MPRRAKRQHGGPRQGAPGRAYPNRTDLTQAPKAIPGGEYGTGVAQEAAQRANPLPRAPDPASRRALDLAVALPPLLSGSERPDEPLTAGLPVGPGAGPTSRPATGTDLLRAMVQRFPSPEVFALLREAEATEAAGIQLGAGAGMGIHRPPGSDAYHVQTSGVPDDYEPGG